MSAGRQLVLPVGLRDDSSFESFLICPGNAEAVSAVRALLEGAHSYIYLCGDAGTGRTHLLEAALGAAVEAGRTVAYVAMGEVASLSPAILEGLADNVELICLDDLHLIAGDARWEESLFHLFNEARAHRVSLLVAGSAAPAMIPWGLPDLASRLCSGLVVNVVALSDEDALAVLTFRAQRRGLELPPETGRYLLTRASRRLSDLVALLAELDRAALEQQRRLTVPFVRQILSA